MPYDTNESLPKGVKSLPESQQTKWRKVFNSAYDGTCKDREDRDECASKIAWSQIDDKYKGKSLVEFTMALRSVTHDKKAGTLRWKAVASDTDEDFYHDNMSLELFNDFVKRISINEFVPEEFRSSFWQGGMPYISVSHYPDLEGKAVPGTVERIYIDGNQLKADGQFNKTQLGLACYYALCKDLYEEPKPDNPIRISIAFLDYGHIHKSSKIEFIRENIDDICLECVKEMQKGAGFGKIFKKGQLVHLALTRVPANERTSMEVEKSMTTRKEDAASIVGEELADEFEKEAKLVGKSQALIVKSDEEEIVDEINDKEVIEEEPKLVEEEEEVVERYATEPNVKKYVDDSVPVVVVNDYKTQKSYGGATSMSDAIKYVEAQKEQWRTSDIWWAFQSIVDNILSDEELEDKPSAIAKASDDLKNMIGDSSIRMYALLEKANFASAHELDTVFSNFKSAYDEIKGLDITIDEKLQRIQGHFNAIGDEIKARFSENQEEFEEKPESTVDDITESKAFQELSQTVNELAKNVGLLLTQQQEMVKSPADKATPVRRSIPPSLSMQTNLRQSLIKKVKPSETPKLQEIVRKGLNLQP